MCKKNIGCEKHSKAQTHTQHSRVTTHLLYGEQVKLFDHYSSFTFLWKLCFCRRHTQRCSYKFFSFCSQGRTGHENRVDWGKNSGEFFSILLWAPYHTMYITIVYNTLTLVLHQSMLCTMGHFRSKKIKMLAPIFGSFWNDRNLAHSFWFLMTQWLTVQYLSCLTDNEWNIP